jgi:hypothetical protein
MSEMLLGRFGDRRLEKRGLFCTRGWLRRAERAFGFAGWGETEPARSV